MIRIYKDNDDCDTSPCDKNRPRAFLLSYFHPREKTAPIILLQASHTAYSLEFATLAEALGYLEALLEPRNKRQSDNQTHTRCVGDAESVLKFLKDSSKPQPTNKKQTQLDDP